MNNILINKKQLDDYLSDFHPYKKEDILKTFIYEDFNCGISSFMIKMKSKISMPKFGKRTLIYWTSRGWSESESLEKRTPSIKKPEDSPMNIQFWTNKGYSISEAEIKIKSQRKMNKEYWLDRGYSEEESKIKVIEFQKNNNNLFIDKLLNDVDFQKKVNSKRTNNVLYWLDRGYSEEESKIKVSERQSTFSKEKCISKHGEIDGLRIWQERQDKWLISLEKSSYNGYDNKDGSSIDYFKNKYNNFWIEKYILQKSYKDKDDIRYLISFKNYKDMIFTLINNNIKLGDISYKLKYPILCEIYSTTINDMNSFLIDNYEIDYNKPSYYERIYGDNWVKEFIKSNSFKDKKEVLFLLSFDNFYKLIEYLVDNFRITDIILKIQNVIISYYYKTTYETMFNYLTNINPTIKCKFGHMRYYNNHLCRSDGEFIISKFLKDNNISYKYEVCYPNSKKRCDFLLEESEIYLEYTGMYRIPKCNDNYIKKEKFCVDNNIKHYFSNNIESIKEKIKEVYGI